MPTGRRFVAGCQANRMSARAILKSTAPVIAHYSGIGKALALRYGGTGVIFMLHSTVEDAGSYLEQGIRCPVATLQRTLCWLRDNGVDFVSLDEAVERLGQSPTGKFCAFTFDDGYADNLTHALPIMESFAAPFTVYVATGMMTGRIDAWWLGLAALIRAQDRIELPDLDRRFDCPDQESKKRTYLAIEELIHSDFNALTPVKAAIADGDVDCEALARREGLSTEQLRRLAASPLVTIGAHGERHINLARASVAEAEQDMIASRHALEDIIDREVVHFAYPFGHANACGPREAWIARAAGFRTAVTTRRGTLFPAHLDHLYALPREPLGGNDTPASLRCKIDGVYRAFHSNFGDPVAHM
jgi:peptidoglycan/xylan/chitin deacetylase (PgdA/CDA1 family)